MFSFGSCFLYGNYKAGMLTRFGTEDILDSDVIVYFEAGVAEWLSRWPRDPRSIVEGLR